MSEAGSVSRGGQTKFRGLSAGILVEPDFAEIETDPGCCSGSIRRRRMEGVRVAALPCRQGADNVSTSEQPPSPWR